MQFVLVGFIIFCGVFTQSMIGFGSALVCMPLLIHIFVPAQAAALLALVTLPMELVIIWRYRHALHIRPFWRVMLGSVIGIPLGVILLNVLDRALILDALGLLLIGYSLYSLLRFRLPEIRRPSWGYGFGLASGILSGAYNTGGPPMVIYGTCLRWDSARFKANLQALLIVNSLLVIAAHVAAGHVDAVVMQNVAVGLPMVAVGTVSGFWLSRYVKEASFRKVVLVALLIIGVRLLLP